MLDRGRGETAALLPEGRSEGPDRDGSSEGVAQAALDRLVRLLPVQRAAVILDGKRGVRLLAAWPESNEGDASASGAARPPAGSGAIVNLPLVAQGEQIGVLSFTVAEPEGFTAEMRRQCDPLAADLAEGLVRALEAERAPVQPEAPRNDGGDDPSALRHRVAELEAVNARLAARNAELEAFAYSVSHDLASPVRAIHSAATELNEKASADGHDEALQDDARRVQETARRLGRLVEDLLAYGRSGRRRERLMPLDLHEVVDEALTQLADEVQRTGAEVTVADELPAVWGDHATLVQAVMNLVANGLKFVRSGVAPHVRVEGGVTGDGHGRLTVKDNGIGIPEAERTRVFGAFERLHGVDAYPGSGLGLAIVQRGVTQMGGRVSVESSSGGGSAFSLELPLAR